MRFRQLVAVAGIATTIQAASPVVTEDADISAGKPPVPSTPPPLHLISLGPNMVLAAANSIAGGFEDMVTATMATAKDVRLPADWRGLVKPVSQVIPRLSEEFVPLVSHIPILGQVLPPTAAFLARTWTLPDAAAATKSDVIKPESVVEDGGILHSIRNTLQRFRFAPQGPIFALNWGADAALLRGTVAKGDNSPESGELAIILLAPIVEKAPYDAVTAPMVTDAAV